MEPCWRRGDHTVVPVSEIQQQTFKYLTTFNLIHGVLKVKTKSMLHIYIPNLIGIR